MWQEEELLLRVRAIRAVQPKLGGRKLYHKLYEQACGATMRIGRDRFFELLRRESLLIKPRRRRVRTTYSGHGLGVYPDLLRGIEVLRPGQVWVSDLTYWLTEIGFLYIFLITDAGSHKIIGHRVARDMSSQQALLALEQAQRDSIHELTGIIHHSDRGSQYCSKDYVSRLGREKMMISMTERSDPRDNAIAERVNGILKNELLAHHRVEDIGEARRILDEAVRIYNQERPHLSCDMLDPEQAHQKETVQRRRWKNYYKTVNPSQDNDDIVNLRQDKDE